MLRMAKEEKQVCNSWIRGPNGHCFPWNPICQQRVTGRLQSGSVAGRVSKMKKKKKQAIASRKSADSLVANEKIQDFK